MIHMSHGKKNKWRSRDYFQTGQSSITLVYLYLSVYVVLVLRSLCLQHGLRWDLETACPDFKVRFLQSTITDQFASNTL